MTVLEEYNVHRKLVVESGGVLNEKNRQILIKAIVSYTVDERIWISLEDFPKVFEMIKRVFSDETMDLYFTNTRGRPSGALYQAFRYQHAILRKENPGLKKNRKRDPKPEAVVRIMNDDSEGIRKELLTRIEPWTRVLEDWKKTFDARHSEIYAKGSKLNVIFDRWPTFFVLKEKNW